MPEHLLASRSKGHLKSGRTEGLGQCPHPHPIQSHKFFEGQWGKGFKDQNIIVSFWYKSDRNIQ